MTERYRRYAVYDLPDGALGRLGAAWLGWDAAAGRVAPQGLGRTDGAEDDRSGTPGRKDEFAPEQAPRRGADAGEDAIPAMIGPEGKGADPRPGTAAVQGTRTSGRGQQGGARGAAGQGDPCEESDPLAGLDLAALTAAPRRYGFHATLKAPFRLAAGASAAALGDALAVLAARTAPVTIDRGLALAEDSGFLALVPVVQPAALTDLAARLVAGLDGLRAPLTPEDIARRDPNRLSPRARAHLMRWGYPHVMELFAYHLTLSGGADPATLARLRAGLAPHVAPYLGRPHVVDSVALMGEDADGRFHLIRRVPLDG